MSRLDKNEKNIINEADPIGKNNLDSKNVFRQRRLYKDLYVDQENTIDFWYENTLYGRLDDLGNAIYPQERRLKQVVGSDCVYALNFVADAYGAFVDEYNFRNQTNPAFLNDETLSPRSIAPKRGWVSVSQIHHRYIQNFYNIFISTSIQSLEDRRRIRTFDQFMQIFLNFFDEIGTESPFTRTGLINGMTCSPNISGLCLELSKASHSEDREKHIDFYNNPFYNSYSEVAKNHGFMIDRNAPWRLVADIRSNQMRRYMSRYGFGLNNLYEESFYKSYEYDIPSIKVYLENFYKSYIATQTITSMPNREQVLSSNIASGYDDKYWIEVYMRIRQSEVIDKLSESEFNIKANEAKTYDLNAAAKYINSNFLGKLKPDFSE